MTGSKFDHVSNYYTGSEKKCAKLGEKWFSQTYSYVHNIDDNFIVVRRRRYYVRKYSFSIRITNIWNSLPDEIISAPKVITFKNRLDRFWAEQEVFYNYKANITGNKGVSL